MTGHAFQCLLGDDDILAAFQTVAELLKPDGQFVFETRNPSMRPWLRWNPEDSRRTGTAPDGQPYEMFHKVLRADGRLVTFETAFRIGHERLLLLSESTLRFCELQEIVQLAGQASLQLDRCWGDWDRTALSERSPRNHRFSQTVEAELVAERMGSSFEMGEVVDLYLHRPPYPPETFPAAYSFGSRTRRSTRSGLRSR